MTADYEIYCKDCDKELHIGQSSSQKQNGWYMYRAKDNMGVLEAYLISHVGHSLTFNDSKLINCKRVNGNDNETQSANSIGQQ